MRLDLYHAETLRIARQQRDMLDSARAALSQGRDLTPLEQNGVLRALQVLVENAIGKTKHTLKASGEAVPVSAYDAFARLAQLGLLTTGPLSDWNAVVGLRNRIVHDYMNIDMALVLDFIRRDGEKFVVEYLEQPFGT